MARAKEFVRRRLTGFQEGRARARQAQVEETAVAVAGVLGLLRDDEVAASGGKSRQHPTR